MLKGGGCRWSSSVSGLRQKKTKKQKGNRNKNRKEKKQKQKQKPDLIGQIFSNQFYSWSSNAWMSLNEVKVEFGQQDEGQK